MHRRQLFQYMPALGLLPIIMPLNGCVAPKNIEPLRDYFFDPMPQYTLIIGQINVRSEYKPALNNVEGENKFINMGLFNRLVNARIKKQGLFGSLDIDILNYGIKEEKYQINSSTLSLFSAEAGSTFSANWKAKLTAKTPNFEGSIIIDVSDQTTIGKESSLIAREKELYLMGKRLVEKFDFKLQELLPVHFKAILA